MSNRAKGRLSKVRCAPCSERGWKLETEFSRVFSYPHPQIHEGCNTFFFETQIRSQSFWRQFFWIMSGSHLNWRSLGISVGFPSGSDGKDSDYSAGELGSIPGVRGRGDPMDKGMVSHSSILAWRISWTEEPGGQQSMGSQRVGHD